ncbi:Lactosylceramide 4-alpha-galactosyltransferase [Caligus rogercresseyi]|uniref:Lactosylceramide 4-alpha-galactosyltransferase n=1 Tax=Caligus rogercresseyi TaxID=217165 RepID=A0A7T8KF47_CALRO|nr:Lactosylceramide 4-alpha-galactosyltransferase [Caligus rogercresseyi]
MEHESVDQGAYSGSSIYSPEYLRFEAGNNQIHTHSQNIITELCAFESAALSHPKQSLYYLMTNISIIPNEPMNQILEAYKNSKIISIDLTYVFKGSPLENLWLNNRIQRSQYYNAHMADILRLWTLYNYGGTYLDSDTITLKKLPRKFNYGEPNRRIL